MEKKSLRIKERAARRVEAYSDCLYRVTEQNWQMYSKQRFAGCKKRLFHKSKTKGSVVKFVAVRKKRLVEEEDGVGRCKKKFKSSWSGFRVCREIL